MEYVLTGIDAGSCAGLTRSAPMPSPSHTGGIEGLITKLTCHEGERVWTFLCNVARSISDESQQNLPGYPPPLSKDSREGGEEKIATHNCPPKTVYCMPSPPHATGVATVENLTGIDGVMQGFGDTPCPFWEFKPGRARVAANHFPVISGA